jgi:transcriptional regulator with GAF, ATPase, and Fis domain
VATTREPRIVRGVRGDEDWLANPAWSARQGVRAFLAYPLIAGGEVLGVMAVFDREIPSETALVNLLFLADVAAARMAHLRALPPRAEAPPPALSAVERLETSVPAEEPPPALSGVEGSQLETSVPAGGDGGRLTGTEVASGAGGRGVVTRAEMRRIEKENIEAALARTGGKVFGAEGAAELLGMKPTTLASRIKALGIVRTAVSRAIA